MEHIVVVGASLAGLRACEQLRTAGFAGRVTLVGAERHEPYDRPPLSKKLLAGDWEADRIRLRKPGELDELGIETFLGARATALDPARQVVDLDGGAAVPYDGLIVATGAAPRHLPGQPSAAGIHVLRTLDDSLALRDELVAARVVVIGAGFIGLEVAATARGRGCEVVVLEGLPAPLVRALGAEMGTAVAAVHERNGVDLRCAVQVAGIVVADDRVRAVALADGSEVPADVVVVGIGVSPQVDWLAGSGARLGDGVICDAALWTGVPNVFAAGDCVRWTNLAFGEDGVGEEMRVEHWTNAAEQGAHAANNLLAAAAGEATTPYAPVPFFWSDQYDSRVQYLGRAAGTADEEVRVVAGDVDGKFCAMYGKDGRFRAVLGVTMPRMVMPMRKLLTERASWDEALAAAERARPA